MTAIKDLIDSLANEEPGYKDFLDMSAAFVDDVNAGLTVAELIDKWWGDGDDRGKVLASLMYELGKQIGSKASMGELIQQIMR